MSNATIIGHSFEDFIKSSLPLYSGPQVTIRIEPVNREYKLLKALLCTQSPVFKAAFEGSFREGEEQATTLEEEDGVVSTRSFELLVQWIYLGQVSFGDLNATESITAAVEFARIADMFGVTGMEVQMAEHIKALILTNRAPIGYGFNSNTYIVNPEHIIFAARLPEEHPVRKMLVAASVRGYLVDDKHKFVKEAKETPGFSSDLLGAVKDALGTLKKGRHEISVTDPLTGQDFQLR